jgi:hypothetical protein
MSQPTPPAVSRVIRAWTDPGPARVLHNQARRVLHRQWPALAQALDALAITELSERQPELAEAPGPLAELPHTVLWYLTEDDVQQWSLRESHRAKPGLPELTPEAAGLHVGKSYVARLSLSHSPGQVAIKYFITVAGDGFAVVNRMDADESSAAQNVLARIAENWRQAGG